MADPKVERLLKMFLEDETPTAKRASSGFMGRLAAMQERLDALSELVTREGITDPLVRAQAIRILMRLRQLLEDLETQLGLR